MTPITCCSSGPYKLDSVYSRYVAIVSLFNWVFKTFGSNELRDKIGACGSWYHLFLRKINLMCCEKINLTVVFKKLMDLYTDKIRLYGTIESFQVNPEIRLFFLQHDLQR